MTEIKEFDVMLTMEEYHPTFQSKISVKGGGYWIPEKVAKAEAQKLWKLIEVNITYVETSDGDTIFGMRKIVFQAIKQIVMGEK